MYHDRKSKIKSYNKMSNIIFLLFIVIFSYIILFLLKDKSVLISMLKGILFSKLTIDFIVFIIFFIQKKSYKKLKNNLVVVSYKDKNYFRELIFNYSAIELGYLNTFEFNYKKYIIATLLTLELRKKIIIEDSIKIIDYNIQELNEYEKQVFKSISNGKVCKEKLYFNENDIIKELCSKGLIIKNKFKLKSVKSNILIIFLCFIFMLMLNNEFKTLVLLFLLGYVIYTLFYIYLSNKVYVRTKLGDEINNKLVGLKKYMLDFSNINKNDNKFINLWEEYLVYAVTFDINKKIVENIKTKVF